MSVCFAFLAWIGMFSAGFCDQLWQLCITQGTIAAIGQGAGVTLCVSAPAQWFKRVSIEILAFDILGLITSDRRTHTEPRPCDRSRSQWLRIG